MSNSLRGLVAIAVLAGLILVVFLAPWKSETPESIPANIFQAYEGEWTGRFTSYSIAGTWQESFTQEMHFLSVTPDSQIGEVVMFSPQGDTLGIDSIFHIRRGDSLYCLRMDESGGREFNRGYWVDGQVVWRSQDMFGRVSHAYRERIRKGVWEIDGFTRTDRGDYLLQHGRAIKR